MKDEQPDYQNQTAASDPPSPSSSLDIAEQQRRAYASDNESKRKQQKKWSLWRHWKQATVTRQIKWILEVCGFVIGLSVLGTYVVGIIQTQRNFNRDHRAYLVVDIPTIHTTTSALEVTVENPGHSVAESVLMHANEATMNVNSWDGSVQNRMINGWGEINLPPIIPGAGKTTFNVPLPGLDIERIKDGKQFIYVAIRVSYIDEISGSKQSIPPVCMRSAPVEPAREIQWLRCNPVSVIPEMEKWDENENPKYKWPSIP
jgi:hypothetical protein